MTALAETVQDRFFKCDKSLGLRQIVAVTLWQEAIFSRAGASPIWLSLKIGSATHLAYDCPKKHSAAEVTKAALALAREAGCSAEYLERSSYQRKNGGRAAGEELDLASLGAVWLPSRASGPNTSSRKDTESGKRPSSRSAGRSCWTWPQRAAAPPQQPALAAPH